MLEKCIFKKALLALFKYLSLHCFRKIEIARKVKGGWCFGLSSDPRTRA